MKTVVFLLVALTILSIALSTGGAVYYLLFWMLMAMMAISLETALATLFTIRVSTAAQKNRAVRFFATASRSTPSVALNWTPCLLMQVLETSATTAPIEGNP